MDTTRQYSLHELLQANTVMVFDPQLWEQNGGDSKNDNFYREAYIINANHGSGKEIIVDVYFLHDNRVSRGHFITHIYPTPV
jgi:hypothetical protein